LVSLWRMIFESNGQSILRGRVNIVAGHGLAEMNALDLVRLGDLLQSSLMFCALEIIQSLPMRNNDSLYLFSIQTGPG
jgi:hypothetical protein